MRVTASSRPCTHEQFHRHVSRWWVDRTRQLSVICCLQPDIPLSEPFYPRYWSQTSMSQLFVYCDIEGKDIVIDFSNGRERYFIILMSYWSTDITFSKSKNNSRKIYKAWKLENKWRRSSPVMYEFKWRQQKKALKNKIIQKPKNIATFIWILKKIWNEMQYIPIKTSDNSKSRALHRFPLYDI